MGFIDDINKENKTPKKETNKGFIKDVQRDFSGENSNYIPTEKSVNEDISGFGESQYDNQSSNRFENASDINEIRANNQPWQDKWGNGIVKMAGTATTSFVEPFVDLAYGLPKAIVDS